MSNTKTVTVPVVVMVRVNYRSDAANDSRIGGAALDVLPSVGASINSGFWGTFSKVISKQILSEMPMEERIALLQSACADAIGGGA